MCKGKKKYFIVVGVCLLLLALCWWLQFGREIDVYNSRSTSSEERLEEHVTLRSIGCTLLTTLGFLMYHIRGKTGGKPQVLFPHIALNQRVVFIFGHENFPSLIIRRVSLMVMPDTAVAPLHPALNFIEVTAIYLFL